MEDATGLRARPLRVVVADDDPTTLFAVRAACALLGHVAAVAEDGAQAWAEIADARPDVVITDWHMPHVDGAALTRRVRAEARLPYVYVVVLTADTGHGEGLAAMRAGADDLLFKPFEPAALERALIAAARVTALHAAHRRSRHLLLLDHRVTRTLATSCTVEQMAPRVLEEVGRGQAWDAGAYWTVEGDELGLVAEWRRSAERLGPDTGAIVASGAPAAVLRAGMTATRGDRPGGRGEVAAIPVAGPSGTVGVLAFSRRTRCAEEDDLELLGTIGREIGQFVERRHAEQQADRLKSDFFELVSHELRTPLTSIAGYAELLLEDELDAEHHRYVSVIERNTRRLKRLVGDVLFVAAVEAGTLSLTIGDVALDAVVADAVEAHQPDARRCRVGLTADIRWHGVVRGDGDRLGQALDNLIGNAIKYTPAGGRIVVELTGDGEAVNMEVRDTGPGIPTHEQERLFERFYRTADAASRGLPGVGLGLTIVKAIAEGHGGLASVSSAPGRGSTFRIALPSQPAPT